MRKTREERLQEIWKAANEIFVEKGFHRTTMEDIINKTELSKGGLYHYYNNTKEILVDMMRAGNIYYMRFNPFMLKIDQAKSQEEKIDIVMDAFMDKALAVTDSKKVYTMFVHETLYDSKVWEVYLSLEEEFLNYLCQKLDIDFKKNKHELLLLSRLVNALLFSQHISRDPDVLLNQQETLKVLFRPLFEKIISSKALDK
jgi:AcrR family transcriptional regulator